MLIGGVFARDPGILIGDGNAGAGDYGSGSVLNGALKPTADTLPEDERGKDKQSHKAKQHPEQGHGRRPESAETMEPVHLRLHTASLRHYLKPDSERRISSECIRFH